MINGTGVDYPTLELGGKAYTVKFSRGILYRMGKLGVVFNPRVANNQVTMSFTAVVDVMHAVIGFEGTHEDLAELVYDKRGDCVSALMVAWGKAFPPTPQAQAPAEKPQEPLLTKQ
jgi:hypothetical protein